MCNGPLYYIILIVLNRFCLEFGKMLAGVADEVHYYATPGEKNVDKVSIRLAGGNCTQQLFVVLFSHT